MDKNTIESNAAQYAMDLLDALKEMANVHSYSSTIKNRKAAYLKARRVISLVTGVNP